MKTRILLITVLALLLCSGTSAQSRYSYPSRKPVSSQTYRRPSCHSNKNARYRIPSSEIRRFQEYYWYRYRIRLSTNEAERILIIERINRELFRLPPPIRR